ncbi:alpha-aminoadipic semialdehyde synthase, mitochondrial-like [Haliotis rubra]|uniref:alpha-aminoadipic semialdehyde synthase, mitochondrial-like n=1 Tax=Haliotis rubra TaxID=36100 RepID=UPI001EE609FF|nr:alpha-aminoadipic semialdehyde synthase, mitochondrial-like [Haliotis rubra]
MSIQKRVLVLGAGRVSGPLYEDLAGEKDVVVTAASRGKLKLEKVRQLCPSARLECVDITEDTDTRDMLIAEHDIVVSLVPLPLVPDIARACVSLKKHLVTPCYVDPEVQKLHKEAADAGLTILCELGINPGMDHMGATRTFDDIKRRGGTVCWCPRNALWKYTKPSAYIQDGKMTELPAGTAVMESARSVDIGQGFQLEVFPYGFSPRLLTLYGIETVQTFFKGSMRYRRDYVCHELGLQNDVTDQTLELKVKDKLGGRDQLEIVQKLGFLGSEAIEPKGTPFDTFCCYMEKRPDFMLGSDDRDVGLLVMTVIGRFPDGSSETRKLGMTVYGDPGKHSGMSKVVGYSLSSAVKLILNGEITDRGVVMPIIRSVYKPLFAELGKKGIAFVERK